jgi:methyl-accepting chemotaxis protein
MGMLARLGRSGRDLVGRAGGSPLARLGVAGRLRLAFGITGLLTVVAAGVAWYAFQNLYGQVTQLARREVPEAFAALRLQLALERYAGLAEELVAAGTPEALDRLRGRAEAVRAEISDILATVDGKARASLTDRLRKVEQSIAALAEERARLSEDFAALAGRTEELNRTHEDLLRAVGQPVDDLAFDLVLRLESLGELADAPAELESSLREAIDGGLTPLGALQKLVAEANRVHGLLGQATLVPDEALLQPLQERFTASRDALAKALDELPDDLRAKVQDGVAALVAFGEGRDGLFDTRRRLLARQAELAARAGEAREAARVASAAADDVVRERTGQVQAVAEALDETFLRVRLWLGAIALFALVMAGVVGWSYVDRSISRRLARLTHAMQAIAGERFDVEIDTSGRDEIATMAEALLVFRDRAEELRRLEAERQELARRAEEEKRATRETIAGELKREIGAIADELARAAARLGEEARELGGDAEGGRRGRIGDVALSCAELERAARDIAQQVERVRAIGSRATDAGERAARTVRELDDAVHQIGDIVGMITDIAEQTNLLALNATIEAARAGDAGRGFAVVAQEVKALATQTAEATRRIAERIDAVRAATGASVESMTEVRRNVEELNQIATAVAAAVEEQTAATGTIARAADGSARSAEGMLRATQRVAGHAEALRRHVEGFTARILAA